MNRSDRFLALAIMVMAGFVLPMCGGSDKECDCLEGYFCKQGVCFKPCVNDTDCSGIGAGHCDPTGYCIPECSAELGYCLIHGGCFQEGEHNPQNPCQVCAVSQSAENWSNDNAAQCDDGLFCSEGDHCQGGQCVGAGAKNCDDQISCTQDSCDEIGDACKHEVDSASCLIGGVCYSQDTAETGNPCRKCDAMLSQTDWSNDDMASCDDGLFCTVGDHCQTGVCRFTGTNKCDDGIPCSIDSCDEDNGVCLHDYPNQVCTIAGVCYAHGQQDPANPCRECDVSQPNVWTNDDANQCSDGLYCTVGEHCLSGACVQGTARDCADALACTDDSCDEINGRCANVIQSDTCAIDNACYASGAPQPGNPCRKCDPVNSQTAWTIDDLASCDDGLFCTLGDHCQDGACAFTSANLCDDNIPCTTDSCDEQNNQCVNQAPSQTCTIGGVCYAQGQADPANPCRECNTNINPSDWTNDDTNSCQDGLFCTDPDTCSSGQCQAGSARDCDDGLTCTTDSCNEDTDQCDHTVVAGKCVIDNACYDDQATQPGNPCHKCDASANPYAWANNNGASCSDGYNCTSGDTCVAGTCIGTINSNYCLIGGICRVNFNINPDNLCEECRAGINQTGWTADDSNLCDDGLFCTINDHCSAGVCMGDGQNPCDDQLGCTQDSCDEDQHSCAYQVEAGNCLIGGLCYSDTMPDPDNGCQECNSSMDQTGWTIDDNNSCDDGLYCTVSDTCQNGVCTGTTRDCSDSFACTDDGCDETNHCTHQIQSNFCLINGTCYNSGVFEPGNDCRECRPNIDPNTWSIDASNSCDDGLWCTDTHSCATGTCVGNNRDCSDSYTCTTDNCDETNHCTHQIQSTHCLIDGTCYANMTANPDNSCQECASSADQTGWTNDNSNSCSDGLNCTVSDSCQNGTCAGTPRDCSDSYTCTIDDCDEINNQCTHQIQNGTCFISGTCYSDNDFNPADPCQRCLSSQSQNSWEDYGTVHRIGTAQSETCTNQTLAYDCLDLAGTLTVGGYCLLNTPVLRISGQINANGAGLAADTGPGAGGYGQSGDGAGYGGLGGLNCCPDANSFAGPVYGASATVSAEEGSGGSTSFSSIAGGAGGGRVEILADRLWFSGLISAAGAVGASSADEGGGGGSGGSILIQVQQQVLLNGSPIISAAGGDGGSGASVGGGGGGGGGRVKLFYPASGDTTTLLVLLSGGAGGGGAVAAEAGAVGTFYDQQRSPALSLLTPASGSPSEPVVLDGSGFHAAQGSGEVRFNGIPAVVTDWGDTQITVEVPSDAITGEVIVIRDDGLTSNGLNFTVP